MRPDWLTGILGGFKSTSGALRIACMRKAHAPLEMRSVRLLLWGMVALLGQIESVSGADGECRLVISANVRGAELWIDRQRIATTRAAVALPCGNHRLEVRSTGWRTYDYNVSLSSGGVQMVRAVLVPLGAEAEPPVVVVRATSPVPNPPADVPATRSEEPSTPVRPTNESCPITAGFDNFPPVFFAAWLKDYKRQALDCGVSAATIEAAFKGVRNKAKIAQWDRAQAEYNQTFSEYLGKRVNAGLVRNGRGHLKRWHSLLGRLSNNYGVQPEVLVALWGLESAFGKVTGKESTITALSTLAYDGRRRDFYQRELLAALQIIDAGHIKPKAMIGSYAGAMGQPQFMPSTFLAHATDGNGDDRIDIWSSVPDALTSAANYLADINWRKRQPWGIEVLLPPSFDAWQAQLPITRTNEEWARLGVRTAHGGALPTTAATGSIVLPSGVKGPAFLVYDNFRVITEWNRSIFYGLTVGHLSDRLAGGGPLVGKPPRDERRLSRAEVMRLQQHLTQLGFDAGTPDGMVGMQTRKAIRDYQRDRGLTADAFPRPALITQVDAEIRGGHTAARGAAQPRDFAASRSTLGPRDIEVLQQGLNALQFDAGPVDGTMGSKTRRALGDYLRARHLPPMHVPTPAIIRRIANEADG